MKQDETLIPLDTGLLFLHWKVHCALEGLSIRAVTMKFEVGTYRDVLWRHSWMWRAGPLLVLQDFLSRRGCTWWHSLCHYVLCTYSIYLSASGQCRRPLLGLRLQAAWPEAPPKAAAATTAPFSPLPAAWREAPPKATATAATTNSSNNNSNNNNNNNNSNNNNNNSNSNNNNKNKNNSNSNSNKSSSSSGNSRKPTAHS